MLLPAVDGLLLSPIAPTFATHAILSQPLLHFSVHLSGQRVYHAACCQLPLACYRKYTGQSASGQRLL